MQCKCHEFALPPDAQDATAANTTLMSDTILTSAAGYHLGVLNTCLDWVAEDVGFAVASGGSIVVSAALIGAAIGSLAAGQLADSIGPGRALLWNNILLLAGSLLCAVSPAPGGIWAAIIGKQIHEGKGLTCRSLRQYVRVVHQVSKRFCSLSHMPLGCVRCLEILKSSSVRTTWI